MPLFAVHLLFSLEVQASDPGQPLQELAIHVLSAANSDEAQARGETLGRNREHSYANCYGELVCDTFHAVVEVQSLLDDSLSDGMEVTSWLWRGKRLNVEKSWDKSVRPS